MPEGSLRFRYIRYFRADPTPILQAIGEHNMGTLAAGPPGSRRISGGGSVVGWKGAGATNQPLDIGDLTGVLVKLANDLAEHGGYREVWPALSGNNFKVLRLEPAQVVQGAGA